MAKGSQARYEGPRLAIITAFGAAMLLVLALGAASGAEEFGYVLFLLASLAAIFGRDELAEINRRVWTAIFGGTGERVFRVARTVWLVWGVFATFAATAGLVAAALGAT
jgi:hypothetical protein